MPGEDIAPLDVRRQESAPISLPAEARSLASFGDLLGRQRLLSVLRTLLDGAAVGSGEALVLRGEPGVGKSALLSAVREEANERGFTVLSATGVEAEAGLPFATLHQLVHRVMETVNLPTPQRLTLLSAFGQEDGAPDLYMVAMAALQLLGEIAAQRPTVLIIDDLQWLDPASADVLTFLARRISSDAVAVLCATRSTNAHPMPGAGLPDLVVDPLDEQTATTLLAAQAPSLPPVVRQRLLAQAAGNPLALIELPRALRRIQDSRLGEQFPLTARLEAAFAAHTSELSEAARLLLVVLAADATCDLRLLLRAASDLAGAPVTTGHLQEGITAGLVELSGAGLRFRHPVMRSAIYARAPLTQRLDAHTCLAEVLTDFPDQQLWHHATATLGSDGALAIELERYAERAQQRGATMTAVNALHRAAELAEAPDRVAVLLLRAAELAGETGARIDAQDLLTRANSTTLGPVERARAANVEEIIAFGRYEDNEHRIRQLIDLAAEMCALGSTDLALVMLWRAASRCFYKDASAESRKAIGAATDLLDVSAEDPRVLAIHAYGMPEDRGPAVLQHLARMTPDHADADTMRFLGCAALVLGDFRRSSIYLDAAAEICRSHGRLGLLARIAVAGAWGRIWLGDWDKVRAETEEARILAKETGEEFYAIATCTNLAMIAALRGEFEVAQLELRTVAAGPQVADMRYIQVAAQQIRGLVHLLDGRAEEAYAALERIFDPADPTSHPMMRWWAAPDLADAAVTSEQTDRARTVLAGLADLAAHLPSPMLTVADEYVRAVLAAEATAESAYLAALNGHLGTWPVYRARLQLHRGRQLRRRHRASEAREPLRAARDTFDALGARPWSEAARNELRATGESSTRRAPHARDQLTPQELQIATLAADGLTNRQIAERLYLSHRTIGSHLYRIYPRLGITSRVELANALRGSSD